MGELYEVWYLSARLVAHFKGEKIFSMVLLLRTKKNIVSLTNYWTPEGSNELKLEWLERRINVNFMCFKFFPQFLFSEYTVVTQVL